MTSRPQLKTSKTLRAASWLVMVGFVLQMGSVSCGCFEHNGWVMLFLNSHHNQSSASMASNDSENVGHNRQHSHADEHVHNNHTRSHSSDQQLPAAVFRPLHQCEPSAVVEAVLTEQTELPQTFAVTHLNHGKASANLASSLSANRIYWNHQSCFKQWPFHDAPARLLIQSFQI